jgi:hypothetical protein
LARIKDERKWAGKNNPAKPVRFLLRSYGGRDCKCSTTKIPFVSNMLQCAVENGDMNLRIPKAHSECEVAGLGTAQNRLVLNLRKLVTSFSVARMNTDSGMRNRCKRRIIEEAAGKCRIDIYFVAAL